MSQYIYDIKLGFSVVVNWRLSADDTGYKYRRRYAFTTYGNNPNTYVLYKNSDGELVWTLNGSISNNAARIDSDSSAVGTDRSNAEAVSDILPVLLENGVPPEGALRIVCQGVSKASGKNVYIYHCDIW